MPTLQKFRTNSEFAMHLCPMLICLTLFMVGCADSEEELFPETSVERSETDSNSEQPIDAQTVIDQSIAALQDSDADSLLQSGFVEMKIAGSFGGFAEAFGTDTVTMSVRFKRPDFERREVYGDPAKFHMVFITNSDVLWIGNQDGTGQKMAAPPSETYLGPPLISNLQSLLRLKDSASELELEKDEPGSTQFVINEYVNGRLSCRVFFDKRSYLPMRVEQFTFDLEKLEEDEFGAQIQTVTEFSDYKRFGSATLPTRVTIQQGDMRVMEVTLVKADFDSPIDNSVFKIPVP